MAVKNLISGRVILAAVLSSSKKGQYVLSIASRYGKVKLPIEATKETVSRVAKKTVIECIPNSELIGMIGTNAVFVAPTGWKGGINA